LRKQLRQQAILLGQHRPEIEQQAVTGDTSDDCGSATAEGRYQAVCRASPER